jgi:hypothetical protein
MKGRGKHGRQKTSAPDLEVCEGEVLYDRHRREWYRVEGVNETGIALHQDGADFYVPHSLFVGWYGRRLFSTTETRTLEAPEWC